MRSRLTNLLSATVLLFAVGTTGFAQTPIMPLGDSITNGGQLYASYRYPLWFDLLNAGFDVDFVGRETTINGGGVPDPGLYPDYASFDVDHEGYWGWRTDEIAGIVIDATTAAQPEIVLIHLGTNDIGQMGAAGVTNADTNLRLIIDNIRSVEPTVTILLAQVIPIGPGSSYFTNAAQVGPLNAVIATVASDKDMPGSPVMLVDQNAGFDLGTMMQSDGLHPNTVGEAQMAATWQAALSGILPPGNPAPIVNITAPTAGQSFTVGVDVTITADASDANGTVSSVDFYEGPNLLASDTAAPYEAVWLGPAVGNYTLTAVATDNEGRSRTSDPVAVNVIPFTSGIAIGVANPSFETPPLADGILASGPGTVGNWLFSGTVNTYVGIFDPPAGSYPDAGGSGTPLGADGENVSFLFNNGGPAESVSAEQVLADTLTDNMEYVLTVAIGRFLPDQPYDFSTYGGYQIELLAGTTVIASDVDTVSPVTGSFSDAFATVDSSTVGAALLGQPLAIRLNISATEEDRSTHFDHIRLTRRSLVFGDGDHDGDVDAGDLLLLIDCFAGPAVAPNPAPPSNATSCLDRFDAEPDSDVDMADFAEFQLMFGVGL